MGVRIHPSSAVSDQARVGDGTQIWMFCQVRENVTIGKAGRSRWKGKRPSVRGSAMNPVDHPHGGGEGKSKGGRHPVTPWGVPTLGKRTRRKHKESDKLIVRGRRRGKEKR